MQIAINGNEVTACFLALPLVGLWCATLELDEVYDLSGRVTLKIGSTDWIGTAFNAGSINGHTALRVLGGAGLRRSVGARYYQATTVRTPAAELLSEAGERLSSTSTTAVLAAPLSRWARAAGSGVGAMSALTPTWRALADGTVWIGTDAWDETAPKDVQVTGGAPTERRIDVAMNEALLRPGQSWQGRRLERVELLLTHDRNRAHVYYAEEP